MPKKTAFPKPTKRFVSGAWVILWRYSPSPGTYRQYTVSTGLTNKKADAIHADLILRKFAAALANNPPEFPFEYAETPGVLRYIDDRLGNSEKASGAAPEMNAERWLFDYEPIVLRECDKRWAGSSMIYLKRLDQIVPGGIGKTSAFHANHYLESVLVEGKSKATRNRCLAVCSRFFKWAVRTERTKTNPFAGIKIIKEERLSDIVYCTPAERDEAIALAKATDWPEWMAVAIACYAGLRREEISRLTWPDVRLDAGLIVVAKTKTGKSRTVPLNATLEQYLRAVPEAKRSGYVVVCPPGVDRLWRMDNLMRNVQRAKKAAMLDAWNIVKPPPSRAKGYREQKAAYEAEKQKRAAQIEAALERLGWNAWRHTFGSLLAQAGVSIDKISAWMGNTPEVCRRHYAQFVPRDRRDEEIDRL